MGCLNHRIYLGRASWIVRRLTLKQKVKSFTRPMRSYCEADRDSFRGPIAEFNPAIFCLFSFFLKTKFSKSSRKVERTGAPNFWLNAQCSWDRAARWRRWMKIQPAVCDVDGWSIQARIRRARSFYLTRWLWFVIQKTLFCFDFRNFLRMSYTTTAVDVLAGDSVADSTIISLDFNITLLRKALIL